MKGRAQDHEAAQSPSSEPGAASVVVHVARAARRVQVHGVGVQPRVRVRSLTVLCLPHSQRVAMLAWLERNLPFEAGGLLYGQRSCGRHGAKADVVEFEPLPAVLPSATRYRASADALVRSVLRAQARGAQVIATVHSHPQAGARPSDTDICDAFGYRQVVHIIVGCGSGVPVVRAYRFAVPGARGNRLYCWQTPLYFTD
jgi:proteasome lid subunit RPN8/RPN11